MSEWGNTHTYKPGLLFNLLMRSHTHTHTYTHQLLDSIHNAHKDEIKSVCFSPNSKFIVTAGDDRMVKIWSVPTAKKRS